MLNSKDQQRYKIAVDIRAFHDRPTGIGTYLENLLKEWLKEKDCHFFLFGTKNLKDHDLVKQFEEAGHQFIALPWSKKFFNFFLILTRYPSLDKLIPPVDVFFIPNPLFVNLPDQGKSAITIHDLFADQYPSFYDFKTRLWHRLVNKKRMIGQAGRIICISHSTARDVVALYGVKNEKIVTIPLGVNGDDYGVVRPETDLLPDKFLLYLGNIEPRKNILTVIDSFRIVKLCHPGLKLVIAGTTFPQKDRRILKAIENDDGIINLGYVDENMKKTLYSQARITLLPSWYEGFGLPILESFAAGTPVITSVSSSMPEAAKGAALLINPFNVNDLAMAINELLSNGILKSALVESGKLVAHQHSWRKTAEQTLQVLKESIL